MTSAPVIMRHLPIFLKLNGKAAVVVGGGAVAARRAEHLINAGARVTTFATALSEDFRELLDPPNFRHEARDPEPKDFENVAALLRSDRGRTPVGRSWAAAKAPAPGSTSPTGRNSATSSCPRSSIAARS